MFAKFHDSRIKISKVMFFLLTFQILHLETEQQIISLVNIGKTSTKLLTSALSYIHHSNFFISTASFYIVFVYFLRRKELQPEF